MKIKEIRTRVVRWRGKTTALPPHFCTNPMDLLTLGQASMQTFTFHGWVIVEIFTDDGHGRHRQCRARSASHQTGDRSLSEANLDRRGSLGHRISLAAHVSPDDGVRAQGHRHDGNQRGGYRAVGHPGQIGEAACLSSAWGQNEAANSRLCQPALQHADWTNSPPRRSATKTRATKR